jgi:hypothetical protein
VKNIASRLARVFRNGFFYTLVRWLSFTVPPVVLLRADEVRK